MSLFRCSRNGLAAMLFSYGNPRAESRSNPMDAEATHPRSTHRFISFAAGGEKGSNGARFDSCSFV